MTMPSRDLNPPLPRGALSRHRSRTRPRTFHLQPRLPFHAEKTPHSPSDAHPADSQACRFASRRFVAACPGSCWRWPLTKCRSHLNLVYSGSCPALVTAVHLSGAGPGSAPDRAAKTVRALVGPVFVALGPVLRGLYVWNHHADAAITLVSTPRAVLVAIGLILVCSEMRARRKGCFRSGGPMVRSRYREYIPAIRPSGLPDAYFFGTPDHHQRVGSGPA